MALDRRLRRSVYRGRQQGIQPVLQRLLNQRQHAGELREQRDAPAPLHQRLPSISISRSSLARSFTRLGGGRLSAVRIGSQHTWRSDFSNCSASRDHDLWLRAEAILQAFPRRMVPSIARRARFSYSRVAYRSTSPHSVGGGSSLPLRPLPTQG